MAVEKEKELQTEEKGLQPIRVVIILIFMIISLVCYFYFRNVNAEKGYSNICDTPSSSITPNKPDKPSSEKPKEEPTGEVDPNEISIDDDKVTNLINLFAYEKNTISNKTQSIYSNAPVIIDGLSDNQKLTIALHHHLSTNAVENSYVKCSELNTSKVQFICNDDGYATVNGVLLSMHQFEASALASDYKLIFGEKSRYVTRSFDTLDGYSCTVTGSKYKCINPQEKPVGIETYSYVVRAYEYEDRLEIHTKYVWLESEKGYSNFNHEKLYFEDYKPISGNNLDNIKRTKNNEIDTYVHTFSKDENGSYFWLKTELFE
jgi:hypothetical protein